MKSICLRLTEIHLEIEQGKPNLYMIIECRNLNIEVINH